MSIRTPVRFMTAAFAPVLMALAFSCAGEMRRPSVVLIIIDTLRADHLSCHGYHRETSPVIDSLAREGVMMENAVSQSSWTLPAMTTIMSGLTPVSHGARIDVPTGRVYGMDSGMPVLSLIMKEHGYATAGFFNVYFLGADFGFHRGFDVFQCRENGDGKADSTVVTAIDWLEEHPPEEPFFLALHFFDPHDPYDPPEPYDRFYTSNGAGGEVFWEFTPEGGVARPGQLDHLKNLYDGEIAYVDRQLGLLFSAVRELETENDILVVLTADHGEEFLEHGYVGHGRTFYPEITEVPLILSGMEELDSLDNTALCGQHDILPTILDLCSIAPPEPVDGRSLFMLKGEGVRTVPSSGINTGSDFNQVSVRSRGKQLIWNADFDNTEMYRLRSDPMAREPVEPDTAMLEKALLYWSTPLRYSPVLLEDWKVAPVLRDLGYIR